MGDESPNDDTFHMSLLEIKKDGGPLMPPMNVSWNQLLRDPEVANKLNFPRQIERQLGHPREAWCVFHRAHSPHMENCYMLAIQLAWFSGEGVLRKYLQESSEKNGLHQEEKSLLWNLLTKPQFSGTSTPSHVGSQRAGSLHLVENAMQELCCP